VAPGRPDAPGLRLLPPQVSLGLPETGLRGIILSKFFTRGYLKVGLVRRQTEPVDLAAEGFAKGLHCTRGYLKLDFCVRNAKFMRDYLKVDLSGRWTAFHTSVLGFPVVSTFALGLGRRRVCRLGPLGWGRNGFRTKPLDWPSKGSPETCASRG
jgi:hypothetical protein